MESKNIGTRVEEMVDFYAPRRFKEKIDVDFHRTIIRADNNRYITTIDELVHNRACGDIYVGVSNDVKPDVDSEDDAAQMGTLANQLEDVLRKKPK